MKALEYSNEHHINIIPQKDFEELVDEVFGVIASNLSKSLGPLGSSATIFNGGIVEATRDGYTILKNYSFNNTFKKMVYNLIKAPCTKMNNTVGDGTTTAIALTNAIYKSYRNTENLMSTYYRLPRQLTQAWDEVTDALINGVNKMATQINPEDFDTIYNIAYVTSNGNAEVSNEVAKTYASAKSPSIKMKDSPTNKSYIQAVNGFEFPCNAIDPCYVRNQDLTATESNVKTMLFDFTIDTDTFNRLLIPINDVMRAMGHKLLVIAPAYDKYMCETVLGQYVNYEHQKYGELNMILTQYAPGKLNPYQREDLAVVLRSKIMTQTLSNGLINEIDANGGDKVVDLMDDDNYSFNRCIGSAVSALISCKNGCIFNVADIESDENYQKALMAAKAELDDIIAHTNYEAQSFASKVYDARSRVLQLEMKNFIYYIGADSELQKQILHDSIEDVIKCLQSATKNGVVPGCQICVMVSCIDYINSMNKILDTDISEADAKPVKLRRQIANIILNGCLTVYQMILTGPNGDGIIKTLPRWEYTAATDEAIDALRKEANDKLSGIIKESIDRKEVWDLEIEDFNSNIITSVETDTMVLRASCELIKILISGNQMVFLDSSINESHQDTQEVYV